MWDKTFSMEDSHEKKAVSWDELKDVTICVRETNKGDMAN